MSRSPLAYPLTRGFDGDAGGAADLQTDIMRFMAILSMCLMAIFALVQSLPIVSEPPPAPGQPAASVPAPAPAPPSPAVTQPVEASPRSMVAPTPAPSQAPAAKAAETPRQATRRAPPPPTPAAVPETDPGFTLTFASDLALTRLVARGDIGFYALDGDQARRLSVRESRLSFWEAKRPAAFHEMEVATVPKPVVDALARAGTRNDAVRWGVTLPANLMAELERLMREHTGGALVIDADGTLRREAS